MLHGGPDTWRAPWRLLLGPLRDRGARLMLIVAALWSLTITFDKHCLQFAERPVHAAIQSVVAATSLLLVLAARGDLGALRGVADKVLIMENAYYSVISPEGCAAILWKERNAAAKAAEALKITAKDLLELKLVDEIIPEPLGGAHVDMKASAENLKQHLLKHLEGSLKLSTTERLRLRYQKFRAHGHYNEPKAKQPAAA